MLVDVWGACVNGDVTTGGVVDNITQMIFRAIAHILELSPYLRFTIGTVDDAEHVADLISIRNGLSHILSGVYFTYGSIS